MTNVELRERRERIAAQMVAAILSNPEYIMMERGDRVAAGIAIADMLIAELDERSEE